MDIDYDKYLPVVLESMYPDKTERHAVESRLTSYGRESFQREVSRVRLGILRLAYEEPAKLDAFIQLACTDYRDLLCAAEYPHTSRRWKLRESEPERYKKLSEREEAAYRAWLALFEV